MTSAEETGSPRKMPREGPQRPLGHRRSGIRTLHRGPDLPPRPRRQPEAPALRRRLQGQLHRPQARRSRSGRPDRAAHHRPLHPPLPHPQGEEGRGAPPPDQDDHRREAPVRRPTTASERSPDVPAPASPGRLPYRPVAARPLPPPAPPSSASGTRAAPSRGLRRPPRRASPPTCR